MVTGTNGKTTTVRMLAYILTWAGHRVGFTSTTGIVINGKQLNREDSAGYKGAKRVVNDETISMVVLEVARGDLLRVGLYRDRCVAAALLNVGREQIEIDGINSVEEMAQLKKQVIDTATGTVVLNADDPQCVRLIKHYPIRKLNLFSTDTANPVIRKHVDKGGIAYVVGSTQSGDTIQRLEGERKMDLLPVDSLPASAKGMFPQNTANAMAAAALAEGMGVSLVVTSQALEKFENTLELSPARFNFIGGYSQTVLLDHAVTIPACANLKNSLKHIPVKGRKICLMDNPGNRPDWHYAEIGQSLGDSFDLIIFFESEDFRRGRAPGEITDSLKVGFIEGGMISESIHVTSDINSAFNMLSQLVQTDDFVAILKCGANPQHILPLLDTALAKYAVGTQPGPAEFPDAN